MFWFCLPISRALPEVVRWATLHLSHLWHLQWLHCGRSHTKCSHKQQARFPKPPLWVSAEPHFTLMTHSNSSSCYMTRQAPNSLWAVYFWEESEKCPPQSLECLKAIPFSCAVWEETNPKPEDHWPLELVFSLYGIKSALSPHSKKDQGPLWGALLVSTYSVFLPQSKVLSSGDSKVWLTVSV